MHLTVVPWIFWLVHAAKIIQKPYLSIGFGTWEFDPTEIENPFPENKTKGIWQGDEDILVPVTLQLYIAQQFPWINYHELTAAGSWS
ncbi:hypothetical protein HanRHA438_Chr01g0042841 [Helianthus annuus]|uniref:Alpha/Beta hydrolase fold protein n=1 Tax=Helianthus annuus TaxID=4232 RepID=A0A9K3P4Q2_HELAN|nr:hypothetical protein HanXRQr2_Chr01g0041951 [Helianthus annuus]KAJ0949828.1 hypothetical protein HanRHA438_Chr01g0042841 [Helianthus annuus]KAJ0958603.1 hypothetical protein HanPSC8_Chr01g0040771 [Helianthus annuus]